MKRYGRPLVLWLTITVLVSGCGVLGGGGDEELRSQLKAEIRTLINAQMAQDWERVRNHLIGPAMQGADMMQMAVNMGDVEYTSEARNVDIEVKMLNEDKDFAIVEAHYDLHSDIEDVGASIQEIIMVYHLRKMGRDNPVNSDWRIYQMVNIPVQPSPY